MSYDGHSVPIVGRQSPQTAPERTASESFEGMAPADRVNLNQAARSIAMRRCLPLFAVALVVVWQSPSAAETAGEFRQQRSESPSTGNEPSQSVLLPPSFVFDGEVREWQGLPPTFELVEAENSRPGRRLGQSNGWRVAGCRRDRWVGAPLAGP